MGIPAAAVYARVPDGALLTAARATSGSRSSRGDAEVHPDECRACSRFDWWGPESQS